MPVLVPSAVSPVLTQFVTAVAAAQFPVAPSAVLSAGLGPAQPFGARSFSVPQGSGPLSPLGEAASPIVPLSQMQAVTYNQLTPAVELCR